MGNQRKWELLLALLLILAVSYVASNTQVFETSAVAGNVAVVGIDAGHGGIDTGKVGINNALEKEINLEIAMKVKDLLEARGITVVMSRKDDEGLYSATDSNKKQADLQKRVETFDEAGCDLVVSIHQNSYHEESATGPQVFYYTTSTNGKLLAEILQRQLIDTLNPPKERLAKANDSYFLLRKVPCPIVIVECGFLSNWKEATLLCDEGYQDKAAEAICDGIIKYLEETAAQRIGETYGDAEGNTFAGRK